MRFTLDDDEDDFWGDATTFGSGASRSRPRGGDSPDSYSPARDRFQTRRGARACAPPIPRRRIPAPSPSSQGHRHVMQAGGGADYDLRPRVTPRPSRRASRPVRALSLRPPPKRPSRRRAPPARRRRRARARLSARAPASSTPGAFHPGRRRRRAEVNPESALLAKDRELGQKEAHLKMLGARLRCPNATWTPCDVNSKPRNDARRPRRRPRRSIRGRRRARGPGSPLTRATARRDRPPVPSTPMEVSNAAALAEARAELRGFAPRRRSRKRRRRRRAAARMRETNSRRAQRESMQLAAEVRAERDAPPRRKPAAASRRGIERRLHAGRAGKRARGRRGENDGRSRLRTGVGRMSNLDRAPTPAGRLACLLPLKRKHTTLASPRPRRRSLPPPPCATANFAVFDSPIARAPRRRRRRRALGRVRDSRVRSRGWIRRGHGARAPRARRTRRSRRHGEPRGGSRRADGFRRGGGVGDRTRRRRPARDARGGARGPTRGPTRDRRGRRRRDDE